MKNITQTAQFAVVNGMCQVHAHTGVHATAPIQLTHIELTRKGKAKETLHVFPLETATRVASTWLKKRSAIRSGAYCSLRSVESGKLIGLVLSNGRLVAASQEASQGDTN